MKMKLNFEPFRLYDAKPVFHTDIYLLGTFECLKKKIYILRLFYSQLVIRVKLLNVKCFKKFSTFFLQK